jgi:hypothetical protein
MVKTKRVARKDFEGDANTRKAGDCTVKPPVMEGPYNKRKYTDSRRFGAKLSQYSMNFSYRLDGETLLFLVG